ncbi:uncharacterized protein J5F26_004807 isoform 2-T13 [Ciconia maguari]
MYQQGHEEPFPLILIEKKHMHMKTYTRPRLHVSRFLADLSLESLCSRVSRNHLMRRLTGCGRRAFPGSVGLHPPQQSLGGLLPLQKVSPESF